MRLVWVIYLSFKLVRRLYEVFFLKILIIIINNKKVWRDVKKFLVERELWDVNFYCSDDVMDVCIG